MKTIKYITVLLLGFTLFTGCSPEAPIKSRITKYADFQMSGNKYFYNQLGEAFTDPGVTATEGGKDLDVTIAGSVDSNKPGVYVLTYSATNSDGFPASVTRYVAVGDKATASNRDLSGSYNTSRGGINEVSKIAVGFYQNSETLNPNGVSVFMVDLGNGSLIIPPQSTPFGSVYADPSINSASKGVFNSIDSFDLDQQVGTFGIFKVSFSK